MALSMGITTSVNGGQLLSATKTYSADARESWTWSVDDSQSDKEVAIAIDITALKSFVLISDQDVVVEFENSTTGVPTINLKADVAFIELQSADMYHVSKFTADITKLFITNTSGSAANLKMERLQDSTA